MRSSLIVSLLFALAACSHDGDGGDDMFGEDAGVGDLANTGADGATVCAPPQLLILLDRTGTMHRDLSGMTPADTPAGHQSSKLYQAITALDGLVTLNGLDQTLQLGLALFPLDPGGAQACLTLTQRLQGQPFANPACQDGQIITPPALGTGATIAAAIDPETTTICFSTPTGAGLETAKAQLATSKQSGVDQYIMLVTDGADFYDSCPTPDPMVVLRDLYAAGIKTFVVGFGAQDTTTQGVNPPLLNRMACAGGTAKNFATACEMSADAGGGYDAKDPNGARLYFDAADATALSAGLMGVAKQLCCGCIL